MAATNNEVYSYHTFFFPFVWSNRGKISFDKYKKMLKDKRWEDISINSYSDIGNDAEKGMTDNQRYQLLQYFTDAARASALGWGKDFVKCYALRQSEIHEKAVYYIQTGKHEYSLPINGIKLRVFNTGVAVMSIETENYDYRKVEDVKRINQFGRRIFAPFFLSGHCPECADKLGIRYDAAESIEKVATNMPQKEKDCVPQFICELLPKSDIKPAIDDRMFVACCVIDKEYAEKIRADRNTDAFSRELYELIYIDTPGKCSCASAEMRKKLIDSSVYERWMEKNTMHAITNHSMICVNDGAAEHVNFTFIAIYTQMITMVLAQRAAIIVFDEISSALTKEKGTKKIIEFQKKYLAFRNQHNNIEITCQEMGVDIYEMLQAAMYIRDNNNKLEKEVDILYETASATFDRHLSWLGIALGVFGIFDFIQLVLTIIHH